MSDQSKPERPRQVTIAAWLIMGGSLFVVATVFERVSGLNSIESRDSVQKLLSEPPGDGLGIGVDAVLTIIRILAMVAGGCATASAILGYHVLQRSKSSRLALSVIAVPLFLTGMATGGFMSSVVVAAVMMLWFQPARDWFDGVIAMRPEPPVRAAQSGPQGPPPPAPSATRARAVPGFGSAPTQQLLPDSSPPPPGGRPGAVVWACALAWTFCGLAVAGMSASVLVLVLSPDLVFDELRRQNPEFAEQGVTDAAIKSASYVSAMVVIVWSVATIVVAALVFRRVAWARVVLLVSAALAATFCLIATIGNFLLVVPLAACVATVVLLARPDVRAWYSRRGSVSS